MAQQEPPVGGFLEKGWLLIRTGKCWWSWPQGNVPFTGNNGTYCPREEPTMPVINCHLYKSYLTKCDLICGWFRVQRIYRGIALRMKISSRPTLHGLWTGPFGNMNCPLSSPGPKPVSGPSDDISQRSHRPWDYIMRCFGFSTLKVVSSFPQSFFSSVSTVCGHFSPLALHIWTAYFRSLSSWTHQRLPCFSSFNTAWITSPPCSGTCKGLVFPTTSHPPDMPGKALPNLD